MRAFAPNGSQIIGTLERLFARAEIRADSFERKPDGTVDFAWEGETKIFYDDQETVVRNNQVIFLTEDGDECPEDKTILCDDGWAVCTAGGISVGDVVKLDDDPPAEITFIRKSPEGLILWLKGPRPRVTVAPDHPLCFRE